MQILQTIEEIIRNEFRVQPSSSGVYQLSETNLPTYPKIKIKQKGKMLIYDFDIDDSNRIVFPVFDSQKSGLTKTCDYIIFYAKDKTLFTFLCELKSSKDKAKSQLEAAWVFAEYLTKMARRELKFKEFKIEYRGLVFSKSQHRKLATSIKKEKGVELSHSEIKYKPLKAGSTLFLDNHCH